MTPQNNLLCINLSTGATTTDPIPQSILRKFMGGKGLAAHYLYNENPPGCDPLSPDNLLVIMNGPLTGAPATNSSTSRSVPKAHLQAPGMTSITTTIGARTVVSKLSGYDIES